MGEYRAVFVQNIGDDQAPFEFAGTDENGNIIEDKFDRGMTRKAMARGIVIKKMGKNESSEKEVLRDSDIDIEFTVTDCRAIIRCDKYDKGGRWSGGLTAIALNAAEKAIANKRTSGKVMLGHIRYEWISSVGYIAQERTGLLRGDTYHIRLTYKDIEGNKFTVVLYFNKGMDVAFIANEILHSASKYRLEMKDEKDQKEIDYFTKYTVDNIVESKEKNIYSIVAFPSFYNAPGGKIHRPDWE